jgi:ABC-type nitrate/sulfonate/bicarbonate transport system substrate-binding protein
MMRSIRNLVLGAAFAAITSLAGAQGLQKVRTFTQTNYPGFVQYVAKEIGSFTKYGIDPDLRFFPSGAPIVQAAAAKEWDIAFLGAPPAVIGATSLGIVTIGVITDDPHELFGRPEYVNKALANPASLKGAKIFVTTLSTGHYMVEGCLRKLGLGPNDVSIIPSDQTATVSAFLAGQGDLAQLWQPFSDAIRARGNKVLCNADQAGLHIFTVWVATKDFATKNPDLVVRWLKANGEAVKWLKADLARTTEMYKKFMAFSGQTAEGPALKSVVAEVMKAKTLEEQIGYMTPAKGSRSEIATAYEGIAQFFVRNGRMKDIPDFQPYLDASFLQKAVQP